MNLFTKFLLTAWHDLLSWFGVEEQKIASFLYPIFKDAVQIVKKDVWADIIAGVPVVAAAITGGIPSALVAAEQFIVPLLVKQGIELKQTTLNALSNALVAQAQAAIGTTSVASASAAPHSDEVAAAPGASA